MASNHAPPGSGGNNTDGAIGALDGSGLLGDALPLEIVEIDGRRFTFVWYFESGVDRFSLTVDGEPAGVIEALDTRTPRLLCDNDWEDWFATESRTATIIAMAHFQWAHRGEIVVDRALALGGQT